MEIKVRVTYPQDKVLEFEADGKNGLFPMLDECWAFLNRKGETNYFLDKHKARSSMVGDIYEITCDGITRYFICDSMGFKEVDKNFANEWEKLPHAKRMMGLDFAERQGFIQSETVFVTPGDFGEEQTA